LISIERPPTHIFIYTMATARITALEEQMKGLIARLAVLEAAPVKKPRAKKVKSASDEEKEPRPPTPWQELLARVRALLKDHEDAKTAVGKGVFSFCSSLKGQCAGDYETLTDEVILENALAWVAPSKDEPAAEPVAEPKAKKPVKKAVAVAEPVAEPKAKKPVKKSVKKGKESESEE
jgi:broad specificity phosphatase PhoE